MTPSGNDGIAVAEVQAWCLDYVAKATRQAAGRIRPDATFTSLGLDSAELLFMVSALEDRFGLDLASDTTTEYASVGQLAAFIAAQLVAKRPRT